MAFGLAPPQPVSLRRLRGLARLKPTEEEAIRSLKPTSFSPGSVLSSPSNPGAYIVLSGWCARRLGQGARDSRAALLVLPGDGIGLHAPHWAADELPVVALTPVIVAQAAELKRVLQQFPGAHPQLAEACRLATESEQQYCLNALSRLGQQSASQRIAHLLLEVRTRLAQVGLAGENSFPLPISQNIIAQLLGLSLVHLNRTLRQMRQEGLIQLDAGRVKLLKPEVLASLSGAAWTPQPAESR
jgi:CRP-like cAMP-binding protein